jgi:hypothetical protein
MNLKLLSCFIMTFAHVYCNYSQSLIANGGFENRENVSLPVSSNNPQIPCRIGEIPKANAVSYDENGTPFLPKWLCFGMNNNSFNSKSTIFDSRSVCNNDPLNQNSTTCYEGNCSDPSYQVSVPENLYGNTPHRLPIDGNQTIGRYVGIQTQVGGDQGIQTRLTELLDCNAIYNLQFFAVKKKGSTVRLHIRFSETGKWNDPIPYNEYGHIDDEVEITSNTDWQEINRQYKFQNPPNTRVWLMVRISKTGAQQGRVLVDDFSLTKEPCNPDNICSGTNDCNFSTVEVFPNIQSSNTQNLRIEGLETVKRLEVLIFRKNNLVAYFHVVNPPYIWIWDGRDQYGNLLELEKVYKYQVKVYNECWSKFFSGNTKPKNHPLFNVATSNSPAGLLIRNLDNVQQLTLEMYPVNGQYPYFTRQYVNPPNIIAWNGLTTQGHEIANQFLEYKIYVSNNCGSQIFTGYYSHVGEPPYYDHLHNPISVIKPDFDCGFFNSWNKPYDRPPLRCCEAQPNIYLSNTNIGYGADYRALDNIYIGNNVVVDEGSDVFFRAGTAVEILPTAQGVEISSATIIIQPCEKMMTTFEDIGFGNDTDVAAINDVQVEETESIVAFDDFKVFPNPASDFLYVSFEDASIYFDVEMYSSQGLLVANYMKNTGQLTLKTDKVPSGVYILKIVYNHNSSFVKIVVK